MNTWCGIQPDEEYFLLFWTSAGGAVDTQTLRYNARYIAKPNQNPSYLICNPFNKIMWQKFMINIQYEWNELILKIWSNHPTSSGITIGFSISSGNGQHRSRTESEGATSATRRALTWPTKASLHSITQAGISIVVMRFVVGPNHKLSSRTPA